MELKKKLLIVEDEEMILDIFSLVLRKYFEVHTAKDLNEFTNQLSKTTFDVFIMDVSLKSSKDGLQLIRELRELESYKKTPIVVITAHAFRRDEQNAIDAGATVYLRKPIENDMLVNELIKFA